MNHAATIAAVLLGLCAMMLANKAINRADQSDRVDSALAAKLAELERTQKFWAEQIALDLSRLNKR